VRRKWTWRVGLLLAAALLAVGCLHTDEGDDEAAGTQTGQAAGGQGEGQGGNLLQQVQDRGRLRCGVNDAVPGFGLQTEEGEFEGFDIDFCRVVAAAVLGDANAVDYRPLSAEERFTALQAREIDVLIRNTTWTSSRDGGEGATFLKTTYYDEQAMMVRADSEYEALEDMAGETICVLSGTTTELNLETVFRARGIDYEPLSFEETDPLQEAFIQERCGGWTSDRSQLAGIRSNWPDAQGGPEALRILDEGMSKEPLGPVVRDGDTQWADAVNWAVMATIAAEELEITSDNVDHMLESEDPEVLRFLGQPAPAELGGTPEPFDPGLGLPADFAVNVIRDVGNYGEIFDRHLGPDSPLELERELNALWTDGGLHYAPPYR
jgi:general L-amino acid transport system substrate-binding protein